MSGDDRSRRTGNATGLSRVQARSRRRIVDAARRLAETRGLDDLSMRELAAEADVSVRTIYNVVGDRDAVVIELVQESFNEIDGRLAASDTTDPLERIWETVTTSIDAYCEGVPRSVIAAVITDLRLNAVVAPRWRSRRIVLEAIEAAAGAGALRSDVSPQRLLDQAGPVHAHRLHQWALGLIDAPALQAGVLYAYDVSLLAVARPRVRSRILEHLVLLEPSVPPLVLSAETSDRAQ